MKEKKHKAELEYINGIHVAGSILWLDSPRLAELCFMSHALLKPGGPHRKLILSERTNQLMEKPPGGRILAVPFFRRFSVGALVLQLVPSGYLPGAAQLLIERDGQRMVYSSDFCLLERITAERAQPQPAEVLILRTQLPPDLVFPDPGQVQAHLLGWAESMGQKGRTALLLFDEAAAALELVALLRTHGFAVHLHREFFALAWRALKIGVPLQGVHRHRSEQTRPAVLVWPWRLRQSPALRRLEAVSAMAVGPAAACPGAASRLGVDEAVCFTQFPDRQQVETYLEWAKPAKVYLTGRSSPQWSAHLQGRGLRVALLAPPQQLSLFDKLEVVEENELNMLGSGHVSGGS